MATMSEQRDQLAIPDWTLGWRLQRALGHAGMSAQAMAELLDVHRGTVSRWMHDEGKEPRAIYLRAWAHECGVSFEWLAYGIEDPPSDDGSTLRTASSRCTVLRLDRRLAAAA